MTEKQMARRNERILKMYHLKGMSTRQIAEKVGMGKSRVHEITQQYELVDA